MTHDDQELSGGVTCDGQVHCGGVTHDGQMLSGGVTHDCQVLCGGVTHDGLTAPCGMCEPVIGAGAVIGDGVVAGGINVLERVRSKDSELKLKKVSGLSSPTRGIVKRMTGRKQPSHIHKTKVKLAISGGIVESQEFYQHRRVSQGFQQLSLSGETETKDEIGNTSSDDKQRSALQQQTSMGTGNLWGGQTGSTLD